ncbi:hypothetical protein RD792_006886 [Penstemon davidsonii]|uniref:B box-type domain-containing protein n=1 Tax=Penstemon davidsonii TaxID=160366 RepID=A0ABR0D4V5_9LAMI|nr:hypothetical protein RD792_006886 [Penstemon davidsonii]
MGYLCDYCREQRSIVFCRSDAASLCLSCDRSVHSANSLSKRHSRTLVCERCHSQPAFVRCIEERVSLCQNCDWMGHAGSNVSPAHKKQAVNCYSGCPSASELSAVWSFLLDVGDSTCEQEMSSMSITDHNRPGDCRGAQETRNFRDSSVVAEATLFDPKPHNSEQQAGSTSSSMSKKLELGPDRAVPSRSDGDGGARGETMVMHVFSLTKRGTLKGPNPYADFGIINGNNFSNFRHLG